MTDSRPRIRPKAGTLLILAALAVNVLWLARLEAQLAAASKLDEHHRALAQSRDDLTGLDGFRRSVVSHHSGERTSSSLGLSADGSAHLRAASGASISLGSSREADGVGSPGFSLSGDGAFNMWATKESLYLINGGRFQLKAGFEKQMEGFGSLGRGGPISELSGDGFDLLIEKRQAFLGRDRTGSTGEREAGPSPSGILILDSGDVHLRAPGISVDLDAEGTTVTVRSGDSMVTVREDEIDLQTAGRILIEGKKGIDLWAGSGDVVIRAAAIHLNEGQ